MLHWSLKVRIYFFYWISSSRHGKTKAKEKKLYETYFQVNMGVFPAQAVVKCDDTTSGIVAGLHAGCWTVGIAKTVIFGKIQGV